MEADRELVISKIRFARSQLTLFRRAAMTWVLSFFFFQFYILILLFKVGVFFTFPNYLALRIYEAVKTIRNYDELLLLRRIFFRMKFYNVLFLYFIT